MTLRRGVVRGLGVGLATVAAFTALSFCGPFFYPADLFSHFRLHFAGAALVLAAACTLLGLRGSMLLAAGLVAANFLAATPVRSVPVAGAEPGDVGLTLATFNLWGRNDDLDAALRMLRATGADVILLQEVGPRADRLLAELGSVYPWRHDCRRVPYCDLAIFSKRPWVQTGSVRPTMNQPSMLWARFELDGKGFTIATTHLNRPPWPIHLRQIDGLIPNLARLSGPVVLGGDFNATSWSYAITRLIEASGLAPLAGLRPTWPATFGLPQLPIDHVLVSETVRNLGAVRGPFAGSDHLAVIARLAIGDQSSIRR